MNNRISTTICLLLLVLFPLYSSASSHENTEKQIVELTLSQIIKIPWDITLKEFKTKYPGGHLNPGDQKTKTVQNYIFPIYLKDFERESSLSLHNVPRTNYITKASKLIKGLTIYCESSESAKDMVENLKSYLKQNFPNGGPSLKGNEQVGYFIPTDDNFTGIGLRWYVSEESKTISVTIQEEKLK